MGKRPSWSCPRGLDTGDIPELGATHFYWGFLGFLFGGGTPGSWNLSRDLEGKIPGFPMYGGGMGIARGFGTLWVTGIFGDFRSKGSRDTIFMGSKSLSGCGPNLSVWGAPPGKFIMGTHGGENTRGKALPTSGEKG